MKYHVLVPVLSSGQVFPGFQGRGRSLSHPGLSLQVQERAGLVSQLVGNVLKKRVSTFT